MKPLARAHSPERLDAPGHDSAVLAASLDHVVAVNRWLGGRRALRLALAPRRALVRRVLDVGTGSADLPAYLAAWASRTGSTPTFVATDRHPQILGEAADRTRAARGILFAAADMLALPFARGSFDVVLMSLALHHLDDGGAVAALREAGRVGRLVVVNELHRTRVNYLGARLLGWTLWRRNRLTRHDGPLSVLRSFRPGELRTLAALAGLTVVELRRRWFYRLVLVAESASVATPPAARR